MCRHYPIQPLHYPVSGSSFAIHSTWIYFEGLFEVPYIIIVEATNVIVRSVYGTELYGGN